jgi:alanyl-tRNA synthetase
MTVDRESFDKLMQEQRERARAATSALGDFGWAALDLGLDKNLKTEFTGYDTLVETGAKVLAIVSGEELRAAAYEGEDAMVVLDKTPFYAEMGGQSADRGMLTADGMEFVVTDVRKSKDGKFLHSGTVRRGELTLDLLVTAVVDCERRASIMRAHSATHLLHSALRKTLGNHVEQAGSLVEPDRLRFDFTHFAAITDEELRAVEAQVNEAILEGFSVSTEEMGQEEAKKRGAMALFGEKYGETVRVVTMGDVSMELCGGTHLDNTAKVGLFRILSEFSVASGVRRIEAVTGKALLDNMRRDTDTIHKVAAVFKSDPANVAERAEQAAAETKEIQKTVESLRDRELARDSERYIKGAREVSGLKVITAQVSGAVVNDLRKLGDFLRDKDGDIVAVLAAAKEDKITLLASCGKNAVGRGIKAGDLIRTISPIVGGSGGGKPESAMGSGKDLSKLGEAFSRRGFVSST